MLGLSLFLMFVGYFQIVVLIGGGHGQETSGFALCPSFGSSLGSQLEIKQRSGCQDYPGYTGRFSEEETPYRPSRTN